MDLVVFLMGPRPWASSCSMPCAHMSPSTEVTPAVSLSSLSESNFQLVALAGCSNKKSLPDLDCYWHIDAAKLAWAIALVIPSWILSCFIFLKFHRMSVPKYVNGGEAIRSPGLVSSRMFIALACCSGSD